MLLALKISNSRDSPIVLLLLGKDYSPLFIVGKWLFGVLCQLWISPGAAASASQKRTVRAFMAPREIASSGGLASPTGFQCFGDGCFLLALVGFESFSEQVFHEGAALCQASEVFNLAEKFAVYGDAEVVFQTYPSLVSALNRY